MPQTTHMTDAPLTPSAARMAAPAGEAVFAVSMPCATPVTGSPFACITLGERSYLVCDRTDEEGALAFRPESGGPWMCLSHSLEDGWLRIGADILQSDPAVLMHFLTTHAVRLSGWYKLGDEIRFDTLGTTWSVRLEDEARALVVLGDAPARAVDPQGATAEDPREQAIEMLIAAYPDLAQRFGPEIDHWAVRLASGGVVKPIL